MKSVFCGWRAGRVGSPTVTGQAIRFAGDAETRGERIQHQDPLLHRALVTDPAEPRELVVEGTQVRIPGAMIAEGLRVVGLPRAADRHEGEVGDEEIDAV